MEARTLRLKPNKVLFIYKYLTPGGVETVLRARLESLRKMGIEAFAWFLGEHGGRDIFEGLSNQILVGAEALSPADLSRFSVISSIDTEEVIPILRDIPQETAVVFEAHSPYLKNLGYLRTRAFLRLQIRKILVPSQHQRQVVKRFGIADEIIKVVPNPVGRQFFSKFTTVSMTKKPIILWVGRLDNLKNWKGFLDVVAALKSRSINFKAIMIGSQTDQGIFQRSIFNEIKKRSISSMIQWFTPLPYKNMVRMYDLVRESGGVVISTSRNESFGLAIAEAMSRGCAILAPIEGPFTEYIKSGTNGILYDLNNHHLIHEIEGILRNTEERYELGKNGATTIRNLFHPDVAIAKLANELLVSKDEVLLNNSGIWT